MRQRYQRTNSTMSSVTFNWFYIIHKKYTTLKMGNKIINKDFKHWLEQQNYVMVMVWCKSTTYWGVDKTYLGILKNGNWTWCDIIWLTNE